MSENRASASASDWMEFQKKYWDTWSELSQQALGAKFSETAASNPWLDALDDWWKAVSTDAPGEIEDFYTRLMEQAKAFFRLSEGLGDVLQLATPSGQSLLEWQHEMEKAFAGMKQAFSESGSDTRGVMREIMAFWELPLDVWQRTVSSMLVMPGDFLQSLKSEEFERVRPTFDSGIDRFLSIPGVGYTREWQEQLQAHWRLCLDYQRAYQQYVAGYARIGMRSVERLEQRLKKRLKEGKQLTALRELYDLWVDCCEDVYGEYVATDQYAELRANLVNSLMALKRHGSVMVDELLSAMSMPTVREINILQYRLQETRREGKALRTALQELKEQVEHVRRRQDTSERAMRPAVAQTTTESSRTATAKVGQRRRRKKTGPAQAANRPSKQDSVKGG